VVGTSEGAARGMGLNLCAGETKTNDFLQFFNNNLC
jgi:hypothetical protein